MNFEKKCDAFSEAYEKLDKEQEIKKELKEAGYEFAIAVATQSEIEAGAACGQLSIILEGEGK
jgi:hypothetical protein